MKRATTLALVDSCVQAARSSGGMWTPERTTIVLEVKDNGLGLSIAQEVAQRHGGYAVALAVEPQSLCVQIWLSPKEMLDE